MSISLDRVPLVAANSEPLRVLIVTEPGLFAAGDLRVQLTRQVTTAVGDATTAAIAVEKYLKDRQSGVLGVRVGV